MCKLCYIDSDAATEKPLKSRSNKSLRLRQFFPARHLAVNSVVLHYPGPTPTNRQQRQQQQAARLLSSLNQLSSAQIQKSVNQRQHFPNSKKTLATSLTSAIRLLTRV